MNSIPDFPSLFRMIALLLLMALLRMTSCTMPSSPTIVRIPTNSSTFEPVVNEAPPTQVLALPSPTNSPPPIVVLPASTVENLAYDADANALLLQAQTIYPPRPLWFQCYLLADLRVWGDERVVRVMSEGDTHEVAVGHLSPDGIAQMLAFLRDQGALSP